jgi:hypothetical protein
MALISPSVSVQRVTPAVLVVGAWFGLALVAGAAGAFASQPGAPPVAIGLAAAVPPLVVIGSLAGSARFRRWASDLDLRLLTLLQTWRVAGLAFLALYAAGELPAAFALPAGLGDVAVGLTAPLVALYVVGGGPWAKRTYIGWTVLGIADLLLAVVLGVTSGSGVDAMASLPMSLVPTFGVPFTLALHAISLVNATRGTQFATVP